MTICIGALAAKEKAIVAMADRYLTFTPDILGETDSVKIIAVRQGGPHALISGSDDAIGRVLEKLREDKDIGVDRKETKDRCETAYLEAEKEILAKKYLSPFITMDDYSKALLKPKVNKPLQAIAESVRKDREDSENPTFSCDLVLCGFDKDKLPYLTSLGRYGVCTDMTSTGFCATGSGSGYALQRLLSAEWKRTYTVDRALFELFDAKVSAENDMNVGYDWDAVVITEYGCTAVPDDIKVMIDRAWIKINRSPYEVFNPDEHKPLPPDDWKDQLKKFADSIKI
jgi:hypothetical protein